MFRIDKRNVKITDAPVNPMTQKSKDAAAPPAGEQPSFLTPEQEALLAQQLSDIEAAQTDVEARVRERERAAQELSEQAARALKDADAQARKKSEHALQKARGEADAIISEAMAQAESIIAAARERADAEALEIHGQAWKAGLAEGREAAEKQVAEDGEKLARDLQTLVDGLNRGREDMVARFEEDIIDLSLAIAKKIINVAIKKDDIMFESLIKNALNQMKREGKLSIRLSEEDSFRLFSDGSASFVLGGQTVTATVVSDPALKEGDCILESDAEIMDAGVDSQIRAVTLAFEKIGDER